MNFQELVDSMTTMTCVVSVEKAGDSYGKVRVVTGNRAYLDSIEKPAAGMELLTTTFEPNSEYTRYLTRDLNFEEYCFRAAVKKECLHAYAHPARIDAWFNMTFLPLNADEGDLCHCLYIMEVDREPDSERMSSLPEGLAAKVLETAVKLGGTRAFKSVMDDVIKDIRKLCGAEHCCILLMNEYDRVCSVLCEDFAEGSQLLPMETYVDEGFYAIAESWEDVIAGSNCIIAKNAHDMEVIEARNPTWHDALVKAGGKSVALFPLVSHNGLLGYIWALNFDPENSVKIKETLEITTFILASEIANYLLLDRLKALSTHDTLTGTLNRNMLHDVVDALAEGERGGESIGLVVADLNGLKETNDTKGHGAGDALLRDAARAMREVFGTTEVFRAGGDEFAVVAVGVTEDEIAGKVEALRKALQRYDRVSLAVGFCVEEDSVDVRRAMKTADARMYEDKRAYYERFPHDRRSGVAD